MLDSFTLFWFLIFLDNANEILWAFPRLSAAVEGAVFATVLSAVEICFQGADAGAGAVAICFKGAGARAGAVENILAAEVGNMLGGLGAGAVVVIFFSKVRVRVRVR